MAEPFIGSEAVANGVVVKSALRTQYTRLFRNVYVSADTALTRQLRAHAGWLWSGRRGVIAGLSAAALHGAKWVEETAPLEIFYANRNPLAGIHVRGDVIAEDEIAVVGGIAVNDQSGNPVAYLDMGWDDVKVAVEYDGDQHRSDRRQYTWDIRRLELVARLGWIVIRVVAGDRPTDIICRVRSALAQRAPR